MKTCIGTAFSALLFAAAASMVASDVRGDEPPAPKSDAGRERIGSVLGKDVYRDQLTGDPPTYRDVAQLFMGPPMDEFLEERSEKLELTDDEIRRAVEWQDAQARKQGDDAWEQRQKTARERQTELPERMKQIEAVLADPNATIEETQEARFALRLAKLEESVPNAGEAWFIFSGRKLEQFLYDEYGGGRIIYQQLGPEALDARRTLLLELEAAGKFEIADPELRKLAYDYWERPAHPGGFHTDRRILAFPWTEEYQAMLREQEGVAPAEK